MMNWINLLAVGGVFLFVTACAAPTSEAEQGVAPLAGSAPAEYNYDSWRTMIPASCSKFFDGCNKCMRPPAADVAACTRMACETYEKPVCLDAPTPSGAEGQ